MAYGGMELTIAAPADLPEIVALVNSAYRGEAALQGWTTEAGYIGGQRTDIIALSEDLAAAPEARLLIHRLGSGALVACVWLEPASESAWLLGMLTVRPDLQASGLGRRLLGAAETYAKAGGASRIRMTVISVRDTLIAWYRRRGYELTGETKPFPYGDTRFGEPTREDLEFLVMEKPL
mgnify:CR=1 FL=1